MNVIIGRKMCSVLKFSENLYVNYNCERLVLKIEDIKVGIPTPRRFANFIETTHDTSGTRLRNFACKLVQGRVLLSP